MRHSDFNDFYATHFQDVYRAAYLSCGDRGAAEDAAQEAFERAFARWHRLRSHPWLVGWAITTALNVLRKQRRKRNQVAPTLAQQASTETTRIEDRLDLVSALQRLGSRQRTATILHYFADLPTPAVANLMSISEGTVKAHLAQARAALRREMGETDV